MKREVVVAAAVTTAATVIGLVVFLRHWRRRSERRWGQVRRILRNFAWCSATTAAKLWDVANELASDVEAGEKGGGSIRLLVSYLAPLPTGEEKGTYYGINFRGTNFLILSARLEGKNEPVTELHKQEVGKEFVAEINEALKKHGVDMRVFAVVNDTIGDLAGGRYYSKETVAAVSLGMGTNVSYIESPEQVLNKPSKSAETVINMQWGNFNSYNLPLTEYDTSLDAESLDPGNRIFEKLISGMYLGEIVRRVLLKMAQEASLFGDLVPPKLTIPYSLRSPDMAAMHQDTSEDYEVVEEKLKEIFDINNSNPMVREIVTEICDIVAERGARLVGAGIVGIVKKMGRIENRKSVVTIEGGLYEHYRIFRNYLHSSVWEILGDEHSDNVIIEHSHGGSGAGSIFLAASQTQNNAHS